MTQPTLHPRPASGWRDAFPPSFLWLRRVRAKLSSRRARALRLQIAKGGSLLREGRTILEKHGGAALEDRLSGFFGLLPRDMACVLADIAKQIYAAEPRASLDLVRRAQELDPQIRRQKWLAFRLFEQGSVAEAAAMLSEIEPLRGLSPSESRKVADIHYESLLLSSPGMLRAATRDMAVLLAAGDWAGLFRLGERLLAGRPGDPEALLAGLIFLLCYNSVGAHHASAEAADAILSLFSSRVDRIHANAGAENCRRFIEAASQALTKTGRHEDARRLIESAVAHFGLRPTYLRLRARLFWPYSPAQTLADLGQYVEKGTLSPSERLLRACLTQASPEDALSECREGEFLLFAANGCLAQGDIREYARTLNRYLAGQGLLPALPDSVPPGADLWRSFVPIPPGRSDPGGPLVSVIMTTFNSASTMDYAIDSILGQTHRNVELLIVDDASSDDTPERLRAWSEKDSRIRIFLNTRNQGTFISKNEAIDDAAGEYLTFHDSDDWAHPERISVHLEEMKNRPGLVASMSDWLRIDPAGKIEFQRWMLAYRHHNLCSLFIKRGLIFEVGYFDAVTFGADTEMWNRIGRIFGRERSLRLEKCLCFGLLRKGSLTQGGAGIFDEEDFSLARSEYRQSWFHWHCHARPQDLALPRVQTERRFRAPGAMLPPKPSEPTLAPEQTPCDETVH